MLSEDACVLTGGAAATSTGQDQARMAKIANKAIPATVRAAMCHHGDLKVSMQDQLRDDHYQTPGNYCPFQDCQNQLRVIQAARQL